MSGSAHAISANLIRPAALCVVLLVGGCAADEEQARPVASAPKPIGLQAVLAAPGSVPSSVQPLQTPAAAPANPAAPSPPMRPVHLASAEQHRRVADASPSEHPAVPDAARAYAATPPVAAGGGINDLMSALQAGRRTGSPALLPAAAEASAAAPETPSVSSSDGAPQPQLSRIDAVRASVPPPVVESTVLSGRGFIPPDPRVRGAIAQRRLEGGRDVPGAPVSNKDLENLF